MMRSVQRETGRSRESFDIHIQNQLWLLLAPIVLMLGTAGWLLVEARSGEEIGELVFLTGFWAATAAVVVPIGMWVGLKSWRVRVDSELIIIEHLRSGGFTTKTPVDADADVLIDSHSRTDTVEVRGADHPKKYKTHSVRYGNRGRSVPLLVGISSGRDAERASRLIRDAIARARGC